MKTWKWMLPAAMAAGACGGGDAGETTFHPMDVVVHDSAGVQVVVNRVPSQGFGPFGETSDAPTLVLGGDLVLGEVSDVVTLADGRVAVGDAAGRQILFFGANGTPVATEGSAQAPAPFLDVSRLGRAAGDTLWVADHRAHRLFRVTPQGVVGADPFPEGLTVAGGFGDDAYLLVPAWSTSLLEDPGSEGVRRDTAAWARWSPRRVAAERVGDFPHDEVMVVQTDEGAVVGTPPFGRRTSRVVGSDAFWVGDQETFELRRFRPDGALTTIVRLEGVDLTLTEALKASVRPTSSTGEPSLVDRLWEGVPATRPAYTRLLLDAAGRLWVAEHVAGTAPPRNWLVFSAQGVTLGLVTVPPGFVPMEVGDDFIWGVEPGGGGQRVVRYGLRVGAQAQGG